MIRFGALAALIFLLGGCGSSDKTGGMKVSCSRGTSVQPLDRLEIRQVPATGSAAPSATLSYPDPLHSDQTGTLTLSPGEQCTVVPATKT